MLIILSSRGKTIVTQATQLCNFASFNICWKLYRSCFNQIHEVCEVQWQGILYLWKSAHENRISVIRQLPGHG